QSPLRRVAQQRGRERHQTVRPLRRGASLPTHAWHPLRHLDVRVLGADPDVEDARGIDLLVPDLGDEVLLVEITRMSAQQIRIQPRRIRRARGTGTNTPAWPAASETRDGADPNAATADRHDIS